MFRFMKRFSSLFVVAAIVGLVGCGEPSSTPTGTENKAPATAALKELHVALAPSEDAEKMAAAFEPIRAQLAKDTGLDVKVDRVTDYASVVEAQKAGKVDLAWYGPLSMVLANQEAGAEPIVLGVSKGGDATYHSVAIVPAGSKAKSLADLKGLKVALVDPGSTSGNLVPRAAIMKLTNMKAEDFFGKLSYAGSHDAALLSLVNGAVDACMIEDVTYVAKTKSKEVDPAKFRILWTSDPIPQSPLAVRKDLPVDVRNKIVDSFLAMDRDGINLDMAGVGDFVKFQAVTMKDYQSIADMAKTLGLSKDAMGK